ncbi:MAG: hypothetical protein MSB80_07075, partial [Alphaproteobacteria bacterium]|nr:hypothetical protein [Alphaproteobacteria bacterium]
MAADGPKSVLDALNNGGTYNMSSDEDTSLTKNITIKKNTTIDGKNGEEKNYKLTLKKEKITVNDNYSLVLKNISSLSLNTGFENSGNLKLENIKELKFTNENKIKNKGEISLSSVTIENNTAHKDGIIQNEETNEETSKIVLDKVTFNGNTATDNGLIYNNKGSLETTKNKASFTNNTATQNGLIYNKKVVTNLYADFKENNAVGKGLIYNNGIISNLQANFENNKIKDAGSLSGIVYNEGTIKKLSGKYSGNIATYGGAIYNKKGAITLSDVEFTNNSATTQGGAIYNNNNATITIAGASTFTDNYVEVNGGKTSNAIHNLGTVNFNGTNIVVNDAITGENGTINIASSSDGMTTFNNSVSGNTVNLKQGTLKLGHYTSEKFGNSHGSFENSVNFEVAGGSLTTQDGETHDHNLGNLNLSADLNTSLDVDLSNTKGDVLSATSVSGDSKVVVKNIKVLTDTNAHITKIKIAAKKIKESVKLDDTLDAVETGDNRYLVEYETDATSGNLKFGNDKALETAVQFKKADKNFNMTNVADIEVDLGKLVGPELTINGNNNVINGNNKKGMELAGDQTLNLNDVSVKGFDGAFAENNGTMNIAAGAGNELNLDSGISGSGDINAQGEGKLNINSNIAANKMTVSVSELNLKSNIAANKMTVSGGELNLKSGSELANVENFVANGGVLNVGDQTVNLKKAEFN